MARARQRLRKMQIFRAADAQDLDGSDFMSAPMMDDDTLQKVMGFAAARGQTYGINKVLVRQPTEEGGFSLVYVWFKANYPLPRHSHNADCMYYVISGSVVMGSITLHAGDSFFVRADSPYQYSAGPDGVEILEIRHDVDSCDVKISAASASRWDSMIDTVQANLSDWETTSVSPTFADRSG